MYVSREGRSQARTDAGGARDPSEEKTLFGVSEKIGQIAMIVILLLLQAITEIALPGPPTEDYTRPGTVLL